MHRLIYPFRLTRTITSVYYALMIAYRGEIFLWAIATSLPLIMMGVWVEAGKSGDFVFNDVQMARYFIAVFVVRQFTVVWVVHDFEYHIVSGKLSSLLLQPADPAWRFLLAHVAEQGARLPFVLVMIAMCLFLYPAALWGNEQTPGLWIPHWSNIVLGIAACYGAFVLRWVMQYAFAMGGFWLERISSAHDLLFLPYLFCSGMLFPLEVLPESVRFAFMLTPFPYAVWFPAALFTGADPPVLQGFAVLAAWIVGLWLLSRWLWRRGLKHYSAMGA